MNEGQWEMDSGRFPATKLSALVTEVRQFSES